MLASPAVADQPVSVPSHIENAQFESAIRESMHLRMVWIARRKLLLHKRFDTLISHISTALHLFPAFPLLHQRPEQWAKDLPKSAWVTMSTALSFSCWPCHRSPGSCPHRRATSSNRILPAPRLRSSAKLSIVLNLS